jgi:hypothetical protein
MSIVWKPYICYSKIHAERKNKYGIDAQKFIYPRKWIMIIADFHERVTQNYLLNIDPTLNQFTQRRQKGI